MIKGKTNTVIRFQIENCWPVHDMAQNMTRQMTSLGEFINISRIRVQDSLIHSLNKNLIVLTECYIVCPKIWSTFVFNRNTHTCKKKVQLKSMILKKSKISLLIPYHFLLIKIYGNENWFLMENYNGKCWHLFSIQ